MTSITDNIRDLIHILFPGEKGPLTISMHPLPPRAEVRHMACVVQQLEAVTEELGRLATVDARLTGQHVPTLQRCSSIINQLTNAAMKHRRLNAQVEYQGHAP